MTALLAFRPVPRYADRVKHPARYWLIDLPAKIVDGWFRFYFFLLTVMTVLIFATLLLSLVLDCFGIRWGW